MEYNKNKIDRDFIPPSTLKAKISKQRKTKNGINLFLEKTTDSLYSIYVYNDTTDSLKILNQDWHLFLIQEAKNKNGKWKPIEYWKYSWCGNSYTSYQLQPNEIVKTESKVYHGHFKTQIRFKLLFDNKIYHSNATTGFVNLSQFDIPKNITKYRVHRDIEGYGGSKLLKKIIFLEPNGLKKLLKKKSVHIVKINEARRERMAKLKLKNKN